MRLRLAVGGFAATVGLVLLLASPGTATAQHKTPRAGYVTWGSHSDEGRQRRFEAFRQALRELGYVEGQSIVIESRWAEGGYDRLPPLLADLVRSKVDVIVTQGGAATRAAQHAPGRSRSS